MIIDMRGKLPTSREASYGKRAINEIKGITIHFTAGNPNSSVEATAAYQTSEAARGRTGNGTPFPGLAYTYGVPRDGNPRKAWDLDVRTWHSAATIGGVARNKSHASVVWIGDNTPTPLQITGMAEACVDIEKILGRHLPIEGHRDAPYPTSCPGPTWPLWKPKLEAEIIRLRVEPVIPVGNSEWADPGFEELYRRNPKLLASPTTPPYSDSLGNVWQDGPNGSCLWMKATNRNFFLPRSAESQVISI